MPRRREPNDPLPNDDETAADVKTEWDVLDEKLTDEDIEQLNTAKVPPTTDAQYPTTFMPPAPPAVTIEQPRGREQNNINR